MTSAPDERLRNVALQCLGSDAPPLAREALEAGMTELEPNVLSWTGSLGPVTAHRVTLVVAPELGERLDAAPSAIDALTAAVAAAIARTPGDALAELCVVGREGKPPPATPYRGRG